MFKISSSLVVLLFLVVSCNNDSDLKGNKGRDVCIKKVAKDGCNICTFLKPSGERARKKRAKGKTAWSCTEETCDTAKKEPGTCLETRTRGKKGKKKD